MVISAAIYVMLLTYAKFKEFTPKETYDATTSTEVLVALSCDKPRNAPIVEPPSRHEGRSALCDAGKKP